MSAPPEFHYTYKARLDDNLEWMKRISPEGASRFEQQELERVREHRRIVADVGAQLAVPQCDYVSISSRPPFDYRPDLRPQFEVFASNANSFTSLVFMRGRQKGLLLETTDQNEGITVGYYVSPTRRAKMFTRPYNQTGLVNPGINNPAHFFTPADEPKARAYVHAVAQRTMAVVERIPGILPKDYRL